MAVTHAFSNAVADATGTLTVWYGATTATVAATDIVRPSNWNEAHAQLVTLGGNTAGVSVVTGTNIVFGGSNNVTLSGIQGVNAGTINISAAAGGGADGGVGISAGANSVSAGTVVFSDSNGVSFGLNGSTVTATVRTDYLTTARASTDAVGLNTAGSNVTWTVNSSGISLDGRGYAGTGTTFNGANISGSITQNSNGLNLSLSVAPGGGGADGYNILAAGTQTANTTGTVLFNNGNGVTFGMSNNSVITATVRTDYLTTARASNDAIGLNTAQSNVTWTVNSSGLSLDARGYAGTATGATNASVTANSNGVSVSVGNYITTARASNDAIGLNTAQSNVTWTVNSSGLSLDARGYAGTNTGATGASVTANSGGISVSVSQSNQAASGSNGSFTFQTLSFSNANGISFGTSAGSAITASHNALTTARASTDAIGLNTAQSNVTWTVNSSGLSLDARGYAGTGTTFNGANVSGSMTVNSNGVNLSLSAGAGGGLTQGTFYANSNTTQSSSGTIALSSLNFAGAGIASVGITNGSVVVSVPAGGGAGDGGVFAGVSNLGNTAGSTGTVSTGNFVLVGSNGITLSQSTGAAGSAGTVSIFGNVPATGGNWEPMPAGNNSTFSSQGQNSIYLQKIIPGANYSFNNIEMRVSGSFVSSSNSQVVAHSISYGLYSLGTNSSYVSLATSLMAITASYNSNTAMGYTISQGGASFTTSSGGTAIASLMSGFKHLYLPFTSTITAGGEYAVALNVSSATTVGTSPMRLAFLNQTVINNLTVGKIYASTILASNASHVGDFNQGVYSVTSGGLPASIAITGLTNAVSLARLYLQFEV